MCMPGAHGSQKGALSPLKPELQIVSHYVVLGLELGTQKRSTAPNHCAISPAPTLIF